MFVVDLTQVMSGLLQIATDAAHFYLGLLPMRVVLFGWKFSFMHGGYLGSIFYDFFCKKK